MKTLTLMRHAKAGWDDPDACDADRRLNARGRTAAAAIGRHLRALGLGFDHVVASPAVRVRETLEAAGGGYGARPSPEWDRRLYLATAPTLLEVIRERADAHARVLVTGHNPGLEDLLALLVPADRSPLCAEASLKYPTATVAEIAFAIDHWRDADTANATLTRFIRPRDLDPALGPNED